MLSVYTCYISSFDRPHPVTHRFPVSVTPNQNQTIKVSLVPLFFVFSFFSILETVAAVERDEPEDSFKGKKIKRNHGNSMEYNVQGLNALAPIWQQWCLK
ncbi:hypothetical protein Droror1_Dr00010969 [Drosera rotundifolia]